MSTKTPAGRVRELLAQADHYRKVERGADSARGSIRLGQKPVIRKGLIGFLARSESYRDHFFTRDETSAIYEALAVVREDAKAAADRLEAQVHAKEES